MKDTKKELEQKIASLTIAFAKVGNIRYGLKLDINNDDEEKLFMAFIRLQNAITDYENKLISEVESIPW